MKLSSREWMIYDVIVAEGRSWSAEDVAALIWDRGNLPRNWRPRVSEIMTLLCAKTKALGLDPFIVRATPLGPGRKAEYEAISKVLQVTPQSGNRSPTP